MKKYHLNLWLVILILISACDRNNPKSDAASTNKSIETDICIYGATASGIVAAIAIKKQGKSVVIVEPSRWVGGILGAGIKPRQDCPNINAVGGLSLPLLETLGVRDGRIAHRQISPKDIREDFLSLIKEYDIQVIYDHRVSNCSKDGTRIYKAIFDLAPFSGDGLPPELAQKQYNLQVKAKYFIDASYEGELMARSGVSFRVGRESRLDYKEEIAGVRPPTNLTLIDPFSEPGNSNSPTLKWIETDHKIQEGGGDQYTQAYNFRFYLTSESGDRAPITPPLNYDTEEYELVGRYVEYLVMNATDSSSLMEQLAWIFPGWMNEGEYNYQRRSLITMAPVGISHRYANGDYGTKARIWKEHRDYLRGLHHFMSTDSRVPEEFRLSIEGLGLDKRHHPETNGWPHQLYIRVSRRLQGQYTITAHDVYNRTVVDDPIGLAQYGIDTYPARRIWLEKNDTLYVALEGKMFIGGAKGPTNVPYPIPYRAIIPKEFECSNLLVPVCFSSTHLGYASARMEPVFMICGESAGIAAVQAINENVSVQEIDQVQYQKKLRNLGQILEYSSFNSSVKD